MSPAEIAEAKLAWEIVVGVLKFCLWSIGACMLLSTWNSIRKMGKDVALVREHFLVPAMPKEEVSEDQAEGVVNKVGDHLMSPPVVIALIVLIVGLGVFFGVFSPQKAY